MPPRTELLGPRVITTEGSGCPTEHLSNIKRATKDGRCSVINVEKRDISSIIVLSDSGDDIEYRQRRCEFIEGENCTIKYSLRDHVNFWEKCLKPSSFVLNILRHGYIVPFTQHPPRFYAENNKSAFKHSQFVGRAIEKLLTSGFVEELPEPAFCCNPLTVADKGKLRLVLDLRHTSIRI